MTKDSARIGFTLPEILIASAISTLVVLGAVSVYLYISKDGKALNSQVEFNSLASELSVSFVSEIETNYCVRVDDDWHGVKLCSIDRSPDDDDIPWIGYEPGNTIKDSCIVLRPNGPHSNVGKRILCNWVSPPDDSAEGKMFKPISGVAVQLSVHIGDGKPSAAGEEGHPTEDTTGPGRQGVNLTVVGSCHDIRR